MLNVANFIRKKFEDYTCHRKEIHVFAGITLNKPSTPVDSISEKAEESLEASKEFPGKRAITVFDKTVRWDDFEKLMEEIYSEINGWMEKGWLSNAFLYRLDTFADMGEKEYLYGKGVTITAREIECFKWRAFLSYQVFRNVASGLGIKSPELEEIRRNVGIKLAKWLETYKGAFIIPLWAMLYENRKKARLALKRRFLWAKIMSKYYSQSDCFLQGSGRTCKASIKQ